MNIPALRYRSLPAVVQSSAVVSPRLLARIAGAYCLLIFIVAPSGAATATPLKMLVTMACDTAVALIFFTLLKPVSRNLAFTALIFRLVFVAIMTFGSLDYFGALDLVHSAHSAQGFSALYALALAPFGAHCLLIGYLIYRSQFLPRFLGVLMVLAGLAYLTLVSPWFLQHVYPFILIPGVLGEGSLTLWLLFRGLDVERWARAAGTSIGRIETTAIGQEQVPG